MCVVQNCWQLENETCRSFTHITLLSECSCVLTDTDVYKTVCVYCEVPIAYVCVSQTVRTQLKDQLDRWREERKPTRCNNIDGLLSIMDVGY